MIPEQLFTKEDSNDDNIFYTSPRLVKHIDENACQVLKNYYNLVLDILGFVFISVDCSLEVSFGF